MPDSITTQIVGAHFRPPAKALLACLPAGHPLWLRPEPTNEYDENAVQVLLRSASLQALISEPFFHDELQMQLSGQGSDVESVLTQAEWHLGYLPKAAKGNAKLEEWNKDVQQAIHAVTTENGPGGVQLGEYKEVPATLSFDSAGKPTCSIPWPPAPTADAGTPQAGQLPASSTTDNHADLEQETAQLGVTPNVRLST